MLLCTLLSYALPFELHCIPLSWVASFLSTLYPLIYAVPCWATLQPIEQVLQCTLLSYATTFSAMLHPSELQCSLWPMLDPTEHWAMLQNTELKGTLLSSILSSDLSCTLLCWVAPFEFPFHLRARLFPTELRLTHSWASSLGKLAASSSS